MTSRLWLPAVACLLIATLIGCKTNRSSNANSASNNSAATAAETGVEKVKPAPGTGNVQGKIFYNGKPAENIEVKLCESFARFVGGCSGQSYTARTDKDGEYVITNIAPKTYDALLARVFDTDSFVFATSGFAGISAAKYEIVADKTFFASPTHLFKSDLKTLNPKAGAKVSAQNLELKWEPYADAAYYKFSVYPEDASGTSPYVNERVGANSFTIDKPLEKGTYRWQVEAFNNEDRKLSESANDIKFTITGD